MNSSVDGKPGRNDPCPCGSGRKYKACCQKDEAKFQAHSAPDIPGMLQRARREGEQGRHQEAEFWYRRVLDARPNDAHALAGIGQSLSWRGRRREGCDFLIRAARQLERQSAKNREPGPLIELSAQLQHWGAMDSAVRLAKLALKLAPSSPYAHNNLALALSRVSRNEEAAPSARKVCELLPGIPAPQILLSILDFRLGRHAEARERLEQVIATSRDPEQTARAWLELGTVLDKLKEYDAAFDALNKAAELHRSLPAYRKADLDRIFRIIACNHAGFDRDLLHAWPAETLRMDGLPSPCFLIGFLRSGTTLTEQVLGNHPEILASDESGLIFELTEVLGRLSGISGDVPAGLRKVGLEGVQKLRSHYWNRVREEYGESALRKIYVDKNAMNSIELGLISAIFPEAKILFALRDPRGVCLSCYMQAFGPAPATANLLSWEGIARQYAAVMDFWLAKRELIAPSWMELRYEDTVSDFENTYRRVFEFLGVSWHPEALAFHEKAKGRYISTPSFASVSQPLYATAVARWTRYQRHFEPVFPHLRRFIEAFGYPEP